jgi:hypothetical protein
VGFPIRKSTDQSFFAAPRGLSQRSTSFIASQRQGIHQMPLRHLIALIINAHSARQRITDRASGKDSSSGGTLLRKTSLLYFFRIDPTACGQACRRGCAQSLMVIARGPFCSAEIRLEFRGRTRTHDRCSDRSPLHDVRQHVAARTEIQAETKMFLRTS